MKSTNTIFYIVILCTVSISARETTIVSHNFTPGRGDSKIGKDIDIYQVFQTIDNFREILRPDHYGVN